MGVVRKLCVLAVVASVLYSGRGWWKTRATEGSLDRKTTSVVFQPDRGNVVATPEKKTGTSRKSLTTPQKLRLLLHLALAVVKRSIKWQQLETPTFRQRIEEFVARRFTSVSLVATMTLIVLLQLIFAGYLLKGIFKNSGKIRNAFSSSQIPGNCNTDNSVQDNDNDRSAAHARVSHQTVDFAEPQSVKICQPHNTDLTQSALPQLKAALDAPALGETPDSVQLSQAEDQVINPEVVTSNLTGCFNAEQTEGKSLVDFPGLELASSSSDVTTVALVESREDKWMHLKKELNENTRSSDSDPRQVEVTQWSNGCIPAPRKNTLQPIKRKICPDCRQVLRQACVPTAPTLSSTTRMQEWIKSILDSQVEEKDAQGQPCMQQNAASPDASEECVACSYLETQSDRSSQSAADVSGVGGFSGMESVAQRLWRDATALRMALQNVSPIYH